MHNNTGSKNSYELGLSVRFLLAAAGLKAVILGMKPDVCYGRFSARPFLGHAEVLRAATNVFYRADCRRK